MSTPFKVVIPARYASTRLPGKPLLNIAGKPMIAHVCERAVEAGAEDIVVAPKEQYRRLKQYLSILRQGQQIQDEPFTMLHRQGLIIPVEFSAVPEIHGQQVSGARVVIRDMRDKQCPHHHHDQ